MWSRHGQVRWRGRKDTFPFILSLRPQLETCIRNVYGWREKANAFYLDVLKDTIKYKPCSRRHYVILKHILI